MSHSPSKKEEALKLGADHFVSTKDKNWHEPLAFTFDFILNCADMTHEFDLAAYMSTLAVNGTFHNVGLPDQPLPQLKHLLQMGPRWPALISEPDKRHWLC